MVYSLSLFYFFCSLLIIHGLLKILYAYDRVFCSYTFRYIHTNKQTRNKQTKKYSTSLQLLSRRCNRSVVIKKRIIAHSHSFDTMRICKKALYKTIVLSKENHEQRDFWLVLPSTLSLSLSFSFFSSSSKTTSPEVLYLYAYIKKNLCPCFFFVQ